MMVFSLLWGLPYLVSAQHLSESTASLLIMAFVLSSVVIGPVIGVLTARHPLHRSWLILGVVAADIAIWTLILALPGLLRYGSWSCSSSFWPRAALARWWVWTSRGPRIRA